MAALKGKSEKAAAGALLVEGDHIPVIDRGPNTPLRMHYKANSAKATPS